MSFIVVYYALLVTSIKWIGCHLVVISHVLDVCVDVCVSRVSHMYDKVLSSISV
jgi:hypothetical protein